MKYELLALDVDGTLIGPDNVVPPDVVDALAEVDRRMRICLATGRSCVETVPVWRQLRLSRPFEPLVVVGGAMVSEPDTGRTLWHQPIEFGVACEFADALGEAGYAAMVFVDGWRHGVEYFVTETGDLAEADRVWFAKMDVRVRRVRRLADAPEMPSPLRISTVVEPDRADELAERLRGRFDGRLNVHSILAPNYGVMIVEAHAPAATKRGGLTYVAQAHRIPLSRVVAVGDDINDLAMLSSVGLGVAMPNAPESVLAAADKVATDGLAVLLRDLARR